MSKIGDIIEKDGKKLIVVSVSKKGNICFSSYNEDVPITEFNDPIVEKLNMIISKIDYMQYYLENKEKTM